MMKKAKIKKLFLLFGIFFVQNSFVYTVPAVSQGRKEQLARYLKAVKVSVNKFIQCIKGDTADASPACSPLQKKILRSSLALIAFLIASRLVYQKIKGGGDRAS